MRDNEQEGYTGGMVQKITGYRAGGALSRYPGPTFFSLCFEGTKPFDRDGPAETYALRPKNLFDVTQNIRDWRLYDQFLSEENHPARRGHNGNPYWTSEPDFSKWLQEKGVKFDSIKFDEPTGVASIAVYDSEIIRKESASNERVLAAFAVMERDPVLKAHLDTNLDTRSGRGHSVGSYYPEKAPSEILADLKAADWKPFKHAAISPECTAFRAPVPGKLGMVALAQFSPDTPVTLEDPKETGYVSAVISSSSLTSSAPGSDYTTLILGPDDPPAQREIVYTFHPGDPTSASTLKVGSVKNKNIDAKTAIGLGFSLAKLQREAAPQASNPSRYLPNVTLVGAGPLPRTTELPAVTALEPSISFSEARSLNPHGTKKDITRPERFKLD